MSEQTNQAQHTESSTQPLFLRALWGEDTPRAPIWVMRQAGRYLPEYRALKEKYSFWELCQSPELAAEVTLQPLARFPLDAAIVFSDIMTPLASMGVDISFTPGPVVADPLRTAEAIDALRVPEQAEIVPYVGEAIKILRGELKVPLIGFAGAPLTLATYLIQGQGSKDYPILRQFLWSEPELAHRLLDKLAEMTARYLRMQVEAGAQAIQLFDSWAGLHSAPIYRAFGAQYAAKVLERLSDLHVPRIYIAVGASHLYDEIATLPVEAVSIDWRTPLDVARQALPGKTLQGNLEPAVLLAPTSVIEEQALDILRRGLGGPHVFNLGHGIFPQTPPEHMEHLIRVVQGFDRHAARA
ncbi:MAG: uroporphyrinogen decarboxylase [Myxococcales bacterium]|nr:uroporphyrinogen decarboxylase [Myxococcales bacterium]